VRFGAIAIATAVLAASPAIADWKIDSIKDQLTDKTHKSVSVTARATDKGIAARIDIFCLGIEEYTSPVVSLETTASFEPGRLRLRYRLDSDDLEPRFVPVSSDGHGVSLWVQPKSLFGKTELHVELHPVPSPSLYFDFDLTGAEQAIRSLGCKKLDAIDPG